MKKTISLLGLLAAAALAGDDSLVVPPSSEGIAFARYIASLHEPDPFTEMGPTLVTVEARLPGGGQQSRFVAIRDIGETERSEYLVLESGGDAAAQELIVHYLASQAQVEDLPLSSVLVTPNNYRLRPEGVKVTQDQTAYVFRIRPRHKIPGLIRGELWIDASTGLPLMQAGRLVKPPRGVRRMEMVREMQLVDGTRCVRVTHVLIRTRRSIGYVKATEYGACAPVQVSN